MFESGQKVKNTRTDDIGVFSHYKDVWVSRHYVKRAIVKVDGIERIWATSSLKEVEEEHAPRALVTLLEIFKQAKSNEASILKYIKEHCKSEKVALILTVFNCSNYVKQRLGSQKAYQSLESQYFTGLLLLIEVVTSTTELSNEASEPYHDFTSCGRLTSTLSRLYLGFSN